MLLSCYSFYICRSIYLSPFQCSLKQHKDLWKTSIDQTAALIPNHDQHHWNKFPPPPPCWMLVIISAGGQKMYHTEHLHICIPERNYKHAHCLANALPLSQGYSHAIAVHISNKKIKWKKISWIKECTRIPRF